MKLIYTINDNASSPLRLPAFTDIGLVFVTLNLVVMQTLQNTLFCQLARSIMKRYLVEEHQSYTHHHYEIVVLEYTVMQKQRQELDHHD